MIQIEYVKGLLNHGEAPTINVQIEDNVPKETVDALLKMGIDKKRLKICHDPRSNEKKIQSLISIPVNPNKLNVTPQKNLTTSPSVENNLRKSAVNTEKKPCLQQKMAKNPSLSTSTN